MNCRNCGVQNVEFATTCYSCGQPLGGRVRLGPAIASPPHGVELGTPKPSGKGIGFGRFLFVAAIAIFIFREPLRQIASLVLAPSTESTSEPSSAAEPSTAAEPSAPAPPADEPPADVPSRPEPPPPPPKAAKQAERVADEYPADEAPSEINGFRMSLFRWEFAEGDSEPVHFGDVVRGQSQITGFEVSSDERIDLTMQFTFRDPRGRIVEKGNPSRLDQPVESDTLYSTFDYKIPAKGPAGDYDLEIAVDDAVSGRSARFRRTIKAVR